MSKEKRKTSVATTPNVLMGFSINNEQQDETRKRNTDIKMNKLLRPRRDKSPMQENIDQLLRTHLSRRVRRTTETCQQRAARRHATAEHHHVWP